MSVLCFGSYATILCQREVSDFTVQTLIDVLANAIVPNTIISDGDEYKFIKSQINKDFIRNAAGTQAVCDTINDYFTKKVMPHIKPTAHNQIIENVKNLITGDDSIVKNDKDRFFALANGTDMCAFLSAVFNFAASRDNAHKGVDVFAGSGMPTTQIADFSTTANTVGFYNVFIPVEHCETLPLNSVSHIKTFHFNVTDNAFTFDGLHNFLQKNIGRYIFSRTQLENFRVNDELEVIGAKAIALLRNANFDDTQLGNELGDIILYTFLEEILKAPKLYTKIELATVSGIQAVSNQGGVHLLTLGGINNSYQVVFGKSSIVNSITEAIDNAFTAIERVRKNTAKEYQILETAVLSQSFDSATGEYLKSIILPQKRNIGTTIDNAYSVFLGYTIDINATSYTGVEFRNKVKEKMVTDIQQQIPYIIEKIQTAKMENNSFYFYLVPFNNACSEKTEVMKTLLNGGIV